MKFWIGWLATAMLASSLLSEEPFYYFIPPKTWDVVDPSKLTSMFKVAFVEHSNKPFKPSLNLGVQPVHVSLTEYIAAAKAKHLTDRNKKWSTLGMIKTGAGEAHVSQIDAKTQFGDVRSMQCMLLHEGNVYVLTAVALREDFLNYHNEFLKAFESFSIYPSTLQSLSSEELKERYHAKVQTLLHEWSRFLSLHPPAQKDLSKAFIDKRFQRGLWKDFEKFLSKNFKEQGLFWQAMASKEVRNTLITSQVVVNQ